MNKQIFHHYKNWECWKNGMWRKPSVIEEHTILPLAIEFTGDYIRYGHAMMEVAKKWKITCEHHLTDLSLNRRAWIGHAACNLKFGWKESIVRMAWNRLTEKQQILANLQADRAIAFWETNRLLKSNEQTILEL